VPLRHSVPVRHSRPLRYIVQELVHNIALCKRHGANKLGVQHFALRLDNNIVVQTWCKCCAVFFCASIDARDCERFGAGHCLNNCATTTVNECVCECGCERVCARECMCVS